MLQNTKDLYGMQLAASDGSIGHVKDFYFDDKSWVLRYLVVDTGSWLTGRLVLLAPHAFGDLDLSERILHVNLTKAQIEKSPSIESHKPVSRQYELEYYQYYGWPAYWNGGAMWGMGGYPVTPAPLHEELTSHHRFHHREDKHLQSTQSVKGYQIQTVDGSIGVVSGFLVNTKSWAIRKMEVETGHWYAGKEILIAPSRIERISYEESKVYVSLTKTNIEQAANHSTAPVDTGVPASVTIIG